MQRGVVDAMNGTEVGERCCWNQVGGCAVLLNTSCLRHWCSACQRGVVLLTTIWEQGADAMVEGQAHGFLEADLLLLCVQERHACFRSSPVVM